MPADSVIALIRQHLGRNIQFRPDLVQDRTRASGALVVHTSYLFTSGRAWLIAVNDNFAVLTAQFDYGINFRENLLHRHGNGADFLDKTPSDQFRQVRAA